MNIIRIYKQRMGELLEFYDLGGMYAATNFIALVSSVVGIYWGLLGIYLGFYD